MEPPDGKWLIPYLTVRDVTTAVQFYEAALGFKKTLSINAPEGPPVHAEMRYKDTLIMLGTHPDATTGSKSPNELGGTSVRLYLYTEDVDARLALAQSLGGVLLESAQDQYWGDRTGSIRDPEGHVWWIATRQSEVRIYETVSVSQFKLGS